MAQVSSQAELRTALEALDSFIQVTADFSISAQINIQYAVTIESYAGGSPAVLTKDNSYSSYMFRITDGGSLTVRNIILDGNGAAHPQADEANRSLIYVTGGTLKLLSGSVLQNNNSYLEGGGVYVNSNSSYYNAFLMTDDARITGCASRTKGGGIMIASGNQGDSYSIAGAAFIGGNTASDGGGVYVRSYAQGTGGTLTIAEQVQITDNTASGTGGGLNFSGYRNGGSAAATLTLTGSAAVSLNKAVNGAGVYFYSANDGDRFTLSGNAAVTQNTASQNGGGCYMTAQGAGAQFIMTSASLTDNTAGTGGGLYLLTDSGGSVSVTQGLISGNHAAGGASGTGGGMWIRNQSPDAGLLTSFTNITMSRNEAEAHGGGMALYAGGSPFSFEVAGGTVSENQSAKDGGGLLLSNSGNGSLTLRQMALTGNTAGGSGGGMYHAVTSGDSSSSLTMTEASIENNTAGAEGGGLRLTSGSGILSAVLTDCTVSSNTARGNSGGGIWNGGSNASLTLDGSTSVTDNSTEEGNGGGIYFNSEEGSMLLTGSVKITNNHADAAQSDFGSHGGGICLVPGRLTIQDSTEIALNSARLYGGAVSAAEDSQVTVEGGTIHDNTSSEYGGGIWIHGGSAVTLSGGSLNNNKALYGGGVYNDSYLYAEGLRNISDGVYIENRTAVVRLNAPLAADSVIQLENSGYLSPNTDGTPIVVGEATDGYPLLSQTDAEAFQKPVRGFDGWEIRRSRDRTQILLAPSDYRIQYENLLGAANPNPGSYNSTSPDIHLLPPGSLPGSRFTGWYDAPDGGNNVTVIPHGSTGDRILYARWEAAGEDHTVTFKGGGSCCSRVCGIPAPLTVRAGQSTLLPDAVPTRRGYCFCFWNTSPSGQGESYLPGELLLPLSTDLCLYAIWKKRRFCCPCPPPLTASSFAARKLDAVSGSPLSGAWFALSQNGSVLLNSISDSLGRITFSGLRPGSYELSETMAPSGYKPDTAVHQVTVSEEGTVTVDGQPADGFPLYNTPSAEAHLTFTKADTSTGQPLEGAGYTLSNGISALSDLDGTVDLGMLAPGTYTLTETKAPDGYILDSTVHTVNVTNDGHITVNGNDLAQFRPENTRMRSPKPVINTVMEGDAIVTGTGVPGAAVTVTFPDGSEATAVVDAGGQWFIIVPSSTSLLANQTVNARQTVPGMYPSDTVSVLVLSRV